AAYLDLRAGYQQHQAHSRQGDAGESAARRTRAEDDAIEKRRDHHERSRDQTGVAGAGARQAERLKEIPRREEQSDRDAGAPHLAIEPAGEGRQHESREPKAKRQERHHRVRRDRVLDHHESPAPHRRDRDERGRADHVGWARRVSSIAPRVVTTISSGVSSISSGSRRMAKSGTNTK